MKLGLTARIRFVKGWFEDTLQAAPEQISLLRIDADWHSSVTTCLEEIFDRVTPGGLVLIDDYYNFDGCSLAVHEFLGSRGIHYPLHADHGTTYLVKKP